MFSIRSSVAKLRNPLVSRSLQQSLSTLQVDPSNVQKRLDVAIVGAPNAGKSQLLNALTQTKVAAVSRKRHTTRTDILGARTVGNTQIVFKDTPGFLRLENAKEERLDRDLIITAAAEMQHVDYCLLVVDSARKLTDNYRHALVQLMIGAINSKGRIEEDSDDEESERMTEKVKKAIDARETSKFAIVLNKVDLVDPKSQLIDLAMEIGEAADACLVDHFSKDSEPKGIEFEQLLNIAPVVFYVSALEEEGVDDLLEHLLEKATSCTSWPVEPGKSTNMTKPEQVQELIREKIYRILHRERKCSTCMHPRRLGFGCL
mmetsp:Transcript_18654/g.46179  ORF Transcript_18654/g.46179 Transcript_18654/m.46179 type:complete len:317 (+) Transcript_18654:67-1017(+)